MDLSPAANVWQRLVYRIAGDEYHDFVTLIFGWPGIVGKLLAERTELVKLDSNVLFVSVFNNVWMQELILRREEIIQDIESILRIRLRDIVFLIGQGTNRPGRNNG